MYVHVFNRYLLNTYCILGAFLSIGDIWTNRRKMIVLRELRFHMHVGYGESDNGHEL